jgi:hypothetical protein
MISGYSLTQTIIDIKNDNEIVSFFPNPCNKANDKHIPDIVCFMFSHLDFIVYVDLMMYAAIFIALIGLLARKKWGKQLFWTSLIIGLGLKFIVSEVISYYWHYSF